MLKPGSNNNISSLPLIVVVAVVMVVAWRLLRREAGRRGR